jgi:hypothetical protein
VVKQNVTPQMIPFLVIDMGLHFMGQSEPPKKNVAAGYYDSEGVAEAQALIIVWREGGSCLIWAGRPHCVYPGKMDPPGWSEALSPAQPSLPSLNKGSLGLPAQPA